MQQRMYAAIFGAALTLLAVGSGAVLAADPGSGRDSGGFRLPAEEARLLHARLGGADRPRLSIAMSGGGIRSSLFNIGVLKALYDQGVLAQADVVSSVSGGSYTTYWLYTNQLAAPGTPFGHRAFDDDAFPQRVCEIITEGNFVTFPAMAGRLLTGFPSARRMYQRALVRTYGDQDRADRPVAMQDLAPMVASGAAPYLIVNASTRGREEQARPWEQRLYEFTPLHHGNAIRGRAGWDARRHPLQEAAVTSGAALAVLNRRFAQPFPDSAPGDAVKLYDGGKTENLGAIAPLLRGTQRLIVIDAQLDGRDAPFEAYLRLRRNLTTLDVALSIPAIDADPKRADARFTGRAESPAFSTDIDYIKMRVADTLRARLDTADADAMARGAAYRDRFYATLRETARNGDWDCTQVAGFEGDLAAWLSFETREYMRHSDGKGLYRTLTRAWPDQQEFPQYSTIDQSFYLDQALAYIGLGYLVAMEAPVAQ